MNGLKLIEDAKLSGVHITSDGYLAAEVNCARTGIQQYQADELGLDAPKQMIRVYRPEEEVFSKDSMATYAGKPVTDDHPPEPVNASNWRKHGRGNIGNEVMRDGDHVKVPLILMDGELIQKVQDGKRELSMGYTMSLDMTAGLTPDGEPYDAIQRNLKMNHVALVDKGRAGSAVRIGDSWSSDKKPIEDKPTEKSHMNLTKIVVDALTIETTDAGKEAIVKLQGQVKDAETALTTATTDHEAAISALKATHDTATAAHDTALAAKDTEIEELKKQIVTGDALDALVADHAQFTTKVKAFTKDADLKGMGRVDQMRLAVDTHYGRKFTEGKSDVYAEAAFDGLEVPEQGHEKFTAAVQSIKVGDDAVNDNGHAARCKMLAEAYKGVKA